MNLIDKIKIDTPKEWLNVISCLNTPLAPIHDVVDKLGSRIEIMSKIRVKALLEQDNSLDTYIRIPQDILDTYEIIGRPTPLVRAINLEKYLDTPANIYIKREDLLPTGNFKLNTAIAQIYYAKQEGAKSLVTETGAGQWGLSVAYTCNMMGLSSKIFWVKISQSQKKYRDILIKLLGGEVIASPSNITKAGKEILKNNPNSNGSIGSGIAEAISYALENTSYKYISGSNLPHVLTHQTIIGLETKRQLEYLDEHPDVLIACVGGGSNLGGFMFPFITKNRDNMPELIGAESHASPRLSRGEYRYDHSDPLGLTPQTLSYTLGSNYKLPQNHVGGLRQHNGSPIIGNIRKEGILNVKSYTQEETFKAGQLFTKCEGYLPAPETNHAIKAVIDYALKCKKEKKKKNIVMCFSGSGLLDLSGYGEILKI